MKFIAALLLALPAALGAPINGCSSQKECIATTITKKEGFCSSGSCDYEICMKLDYGGACTKGGGTVSHTCVRPTDQCTDTDWAGSTETLSIGPSLTQCQTVPAGEKAMFLLKDGNGCGDELASPFDLNGLSTTCTATTEKGEACTGNKAGFECIWEIEAPTTCGGGGGSGGDPHFRLFNSTRYFFHGEGDLVLLSNPSFDEGVGVDMHIRTTIQDFYSYISSTAIRLGKDIFEVDVGAAHHFKINGVEMSNDDLPLTLADGRYTLNPPTTMGTAEVYMIDLSDSGDYIKVRTYKQLMAVDFMGEPKYFGDSVGMLGNFYTSEMLARDGHTIIHNEDAFGMEWQVRDTDPTLFSEARAPQWPVGMNMPTVTERHLSASPEEVARAEEVCAHKSSNDFEFCVTDVLATGDEGMAGAW